MYWYNIPRCVDRLPVSLFFMLPDVVQWFSKAGVSANYVASLCKSLQNALSLCEVGHGHVVESPRSTRQRNAQHGREHVRLVPENSAMISTAGLLVGLTELIVNKKFKLLFGPSEGEGDDDALPEDEVLANRSKVSSLLQLIIKNILGDRSMSLPIKVDNEHDSTMRLDIDNARVNIDSFHAFLAGMKLRKNQWTALLLLSVCRLGEPLGPLMSRIVGGSVSLR